ncbi:RDD family protein [Fulvivirgaceae bacterium PWU4]|uniref:RDD family protein n=1 Tax=Chryseosolibacter histidini TaxID=2782349 RepID=A0AAP2DPY4_9BACT|nr:RDD family protein [Chryseosolibacter histidini]MBT1699208.1 RDD family protein [Chryseosolibacter histidini]
MEEILDEPLIEINKNTVKYGGFWKRFVAVLIDGVILTPVTLGVTYFNTIDWKNPAIFIAVSLAGMAYKPVMESLYGATLGKMALKLKVVNGNFEMAGIGTILLRNSLSLVPSIVTLAMTLPVYFHAEFASVSGFMEYTSFIEGHTSAQVVNMFSGLITIVDGIVMMADNRSRSLHDKIADTLVIDRS